VIRPSPLTTAVYVRRFLVEWRARNLEGNAHTCPRYATLLEKGVLVSDVAYSCRECGSEFTLNFRGSDCPDCGNPLVDIRALRETTVRTTTRHLISGCRVVEEFGVVTGSTVRARHLGAKLLAGVSQNFGGELGGYTQLLQDARFESVERMCDEAREVGANAVLGVSFNTGELFEIAVELLAYGTAVTIEPDGLQSVQDS